MDTDEGGGEFQTITKTRKTPSWPRSATPKHETDGERKSERESNCDCVAGDGRKERKREKEGRNATSPRKNLRATRRIQRLVVQINTDKTGDYRKPRKLELSAKHLRGTRRIQGLVVQMDTEEGG
jgi:hypothetical protein